jgi:hypothetical protein
VASKLAASILVKLIDQASGPAGKISKSLRAINAAAKGSGKLDFKVNTKSLDGVTSKLRRIKQEMRGVGKVDLKVGAKSLDSAARSARKLTKELTSAATAAKSIKVSLGGQGASPFGAMRRDLRGVLADLKKVQALSKGVGAGRGGGRGGGYGYGPGPGNGRGYGRGYNGTREAGSHIGVRAAERAFHAGGGAARGAGRVGADTMREDARDYLAGLKPEDTKRLQERAGTLSAQFPSVDRNTLHEMLRDTAMSMGTVDKSMENSESLGRMATVMQSMKGKEKAIENLRQFYSALDVLGRNIDPKQVNKLADAYTKATGVEGAEMDMGRLLQVAKQSRAAGAGLDDDFLMYAVPALMQDLGAPQVGTALASGLSQVIAGRGTKESKYVQSAFGLRRDDLTMTKGDMDMFSKNPQEYAEKRLMPALAKGASIPQRDKKGKIIGRENVPGIDFSKDDSDMKVAQVIPKIFSNRVVGDIFTKLITQREQYARKREQYNNAPGLSAADSLRNRDPYVAGEAALSQTRNVAGELVKPLVEPVTQGINKAADALAVTAETMRKNPENTAIVAPVVAGVVGSVGSWLAGQTLLGVAGNSTGLWAGAARLAGTGLSAAGTSTGAVPLAAIAGVGAAANESDAMSEGLVTSALTGSKTPGARLIEEIKRNAEAKVAEDAVRASGHDFSQRSMGVFGSSQDPVSSSYEASRGAVGDFLLGKQRGSADLPGFGSGTSLPGADKAAEATQALEKYKAELASINSQLEGLKASGQAAFSPETFGLEAKKAELESLVSGAKTKFEELGAVSVAPKVDASSVSTAIGLVDQLIAKLGQAGSAAGGLAGKIEGATSAAGRALSSLDRAKQTSTSASPN